MSSRKHPSRLTLRPRLFLLGIPVVLGAAALLTSAMPGGRAADAAPPPAPAAVAVASASPSPASPSSSPSATPSASPTSSAAPSSSASPSPAASPALSARVTRSRADAAIDAFDRAFYVERGGRGYFRLTTGSSRLAVFWRTAEMIETVEDAAERSGDQRYLRMVAKLTRGVSLRWGGVWTGRSYNDDIIWMVLAFERASRLTGDPSLRAVAKRNFDATFARAWSADLGGGLWWTTDRGEKNTCVNAPAALAAARLSRSLHQLSYLRKAERLYAWTRAHLYDRRTGAVYDHVSPVGDDARLDRATYTYNQGTFAGAAALLARTTGDDSYLGDAHDALAYARDHMSEGGVLPDEGDGGDGGGFKGILARHAGDYARRDPSHEFDAWLTANGEAAWSHRDGRGLIGQDWSRSAAGGRLHAFDASAGVTLLQQLRRR